MYTLLLLQLIAHFLADFNFQPQRWCDAKEAKIVSKQHFYHALTVFVFAYIFSLDSGFWFAAIVIAVAHFGLDILKSWLIKQFSEWKGILFFIDQILHIAIIVLAVNLFWSSKYECQPLPFIENHNRIILFALALVFCTSPANACIRNAMSVWKIFPVDDKENKSLENAGRVIGTLERILTLILVVFFQFAAVGFVFAAKSILRYRDTQTAKTEYLLVGSLLSFGIAIVLGLLFTFIKL